MWVGSSFLLMVAVGAFATTRRERELLLRAQRNAVEAATANMALGGGGGGGGVRLAENPLYFRDTQPLLGVQMVPAGAYPAEVVPQQQAAGGGLPPGMVMAAGQMMMQAPPALVGAPHR